MHPSNASRFALLAVSLVATLTGACLGVDPPEGRLRCASATAATDCPSGWFCRADDRCWRTPGEGVDAGMDAGSADAFVPDPDAFDFDAPGLDAPMPDAFAERDAFMADDAGPMPDAFVPPDAYSECTTAADCNDADLCTIDDCVDNLCTHESVVCNDGFSCTLDACAPATGCTYPPNAAAPCPAGRTCDPTGTGMDGMGADAAGCIDADDCTTAAMCDDGNYCTIDSCMTGACMNAPRTCTTDTNPCTLAAFCDEDMDRCNEPFDVTSLSEPTHCGTSAATCTVCPTVGANTVATCNMGVCGVSCLGGFYNVDGVAANGCEYACTFVSARDDLDASAVDANCDGADGVLENVEYVYVAAGGLGTGAAGSPATAVNVARAFKIATTRSAMGIRVQLALASGTYNISAPLSMPGGVTMWGGYASDYRTRGGSRSLVASSADRALIIDGVTTTLDSVDFSTADQSGSGASTRTITVISSTNAVIRNARITAGAGGAGAPGAPGTNRTGTTTPAATGGAGTSTMGGNGGGPAGNPSSGGIGATFGNLAGPGQAASMSSSGCGSPAGSRGVGASIMCACLLDNFSSSNPGGSGTNGCNGGMGGHGTGGSGYGSISTTGSWVPSSAGNGGDGLQGIGGAGGGGAAGLECNATSTWGAGTRVSGGGGGQGGMGGPGGGGGSAGGAGGASIGIAAYASTLTLTGTTITTASGGAGGRGGDGGTGGGGQPGGAGGAGLSVMPSGCSSGRIRGGDGGPGGSGGGGGRGGCGGGGAGGPSIGIFGSGGTTVSGSPSVTPGSGGALGAECPIGGGNRGTMGASMSQILL
jgi:hypothetical protein